MPEMIKISENVYCPKNLLIDEKGLPTLLHSMIMLELHPEIYTMENLDKAFENFKKRRKSSKKKRR